jgi:hypothetical protein
MKPYVLLVLALFPFGCSSGPKPDTAKKEVAAALDAFSQRKIYTRLDPTVLRSIKDDDLEQAVIDYAISKLEGKHEQEKTVLGSFSPGVRALYLSWVVEMEVNNGGFSQYYFNTGGESADEAVEAFEFFEATQHARLMREANGIRAQEAAAMAKYKDAGTLEALAESYEHTKLGSVDERFVNLTENLSELRVARIRRTPEQFSGE